MRREARVGFKGRTRRGGEGATAGGTDAEVRAVGGEAGSAASRWVRGWPGGMRTQNS